ncbi:triple tyrosine motif-containing protein [Larkinella soli]|uniref:triple tyrosine motif-containing protein n=1 Tax=Larkinella soli TaxID=1770527 RepID=UPI000FFC2E62|nr:triple tyrosine motif-containing protein [Larkinella soli]
MKIRCPDKILLLCLFWFLGTLNSQASGITKNILFAPYIRNFTKQNYQAYNQNWSLSQDTSTGFIYAANSKGLLEFDGTRWQTYRLPKRQIVRSVAADGRDRVYTGGLGEFGYWEPNPSGLLEYHSLADRVPNRQFAREEIWNIVAGRDFVFFQSFSTAFIYRRNRVTELKLPGNVFFLYEAGGRYYLQAIGKGLYELTGGKFISLPGTEALAGTEVHTILPDGQEGLLLGTRDHGMYRYRRGTLTRLRHPASQFLQRYQCNRGLRLPDGRYAFGTILNGLIVTDTTGRILYSLNQRSGLQNNTILALLADARGNLWAGLDDGIDAMSFHYPLKYFTDPSGLLGTPYDAALFNGRLYLGTNHGVYWCAFPTSGLPAYHLVEGSQGQVWDLAVLDGQLVCGHNAGTFRVTREGRWERLSDLAGGWHLLRLRSHPGVALQGTYTGLALYRRTESGQWAFSHRIDGFGEPIREIREAPDGRLRLRHAHNGFYQIALSGDLKKVTNICFFDQPVPASGFTDGSKFRRVFAGLQGESLAVRKGGSLLITNRRGLKAEFPLSNFAWMDDYENIIPLDSSYYLLCLEKGYALLPRAELTAIGREQAENRPLIRQLAVLQGGSDLRFEFRSATAAGAFGRRLAARENHLVFQFSQPEAIQQPLFSYRLVGLDDEWSEFGAASEKEYTSLAPGTYRFQVRALSGGPESSLTFEIRPPWYRSSWAFLGYFLFGCGVVALSFYVHRRQVHAHQVRVREHLERQLREEQERHRQQLIRMQKEKLEQDVISKSEELANTTMSLIHKSDLLMKLKGEAEKLKTEVQQRQGIEQATSHINHLIKLIDANISSRQDWKVFEKNFNKVHEQFFKQLLERYDGLTPDDLRLAAYLRMNLSSKEVAKLLNITVRGVELKRYRLRKRLHLPPETNLTEFMMTF